jgi:hypothetical protein
VVEKEYQTSNLSPLTVVCVENHPALFENCFSFGKTKSVNPQGNDQMLKLTTGNINGVAVSHTFHINQPMDVIPDVLGSLDASEATTRNIDEQKCYLLRAMIRAMHYIDDMGGYTAASERSLLKSFLSEIYGAAWSQESQDSDKLPSLDLLQESVVQANIADMSGRLLDIVTTGKIMREFKAAQAENIRQRELGAEGRPIPEEELNFRGLIRVYYLPKRNDENPKQKRSSRYTQLGKFISYEFIHILAEIMDDPQTQTQVVNTTKEVTAPAEEKKKEATPLIEKPQKQAPRNHPINPERTYQTLLAGKGSAWDQMVFAMGQRAAIEGLMHSHLLPAISAIGGDVTHHFKRATET